MHDFKYDRSTRRSPLAAGRQNAANATPAQASSNRSRGPQRPWGHAGWGAVPFADVSRQEDIATHLLSLRQGQEILSALLEFAREERLVSGSLKASGAVRSAQIACWDSATHDYTQVHVREEAELSLIGGLGLADGQALLHAHAVLRLRDGSTRTGHLLRAHVRSNLKITLAGWSRPLRCANEPETGVDPLCLAS